MEFLGEEGGGTISATESLAGLLLGGMVWTERLPAQHWRDLGLNIILRLRVNEKIKLFVRELFTRSLGKKTHWLLRTENPLVRCVESLSKGGGTLEVGFVQTGWESFHNEINLRVCYIWF